MVRLQAEPQFLFFASVYLASLDNYRYHQKQLGASRLKPSWTTPLTSIAGRPIKQKYDPNQMFGKTRR